MLAFMLAFIIAFADHHCSIFLINGKGSILGRQHTVATRFIEVILFNGVLNSNSSNNIYIHKNVHKGLVSIGADDLLLMFLQVAGPASGTLSNMHNRKPEQRLCQ